MTRARDEKAEKTLRISRTGDSCIKRRLQPLFLGPQLPRPALAARKAAARERGRRGSVPLDGCHVAVAQAPAGNLKPAKDKSTERIDGIVALIMAIGRAMVAQEEPQPAYPMFFV
jgi:hypothetical protein